MSVRHPRPIEAEPEAVLRDWRVFELVRHGLKTRHFAGFNTITRLGRVSSPIVQFDRGRLVGVTASGRRYMLEGDPGPRDGVALYAWRQWCRHGGHGAVGVDVTDKYVRSN